MQNKPGDTLRSLLRDACGTLQDIIPLIAMLAVLGRRNWRILALSLLTVPVDGALVWLTTLLNEQAEKLKRKQVMKGATGVNLAGGPAVEPAARAQAR